MRKGGGDYVSVGTMVDAGRALNWQVEQSES